MFLPHKVLENRLLEILAEDIGQGDVTTELIIPSQTTAKAEIVAREPGIIAGVEETKVLLESLGLEVDALVKDGDKAKKGQTLMKILGNARTILSAERTILNILSRMSGIATTTRKLVEELDRARLKVKVACTRKTAPGLLYFDKKAVLIGGGDPHRFHLDDMILIKDNHIAIAGDLKKAVEKARSKSSFSKKIEVEVSNVKDALTAVEAGADIVMLDNFSSKEIEEVCALLRKAKLQGKALLEASGGINSGNMLSFASTGVDIVSLGEITNSVRALNINLKIAKA